MGRRSVNSTKAGKFMNPTDQARKEARRRELKKNKKQRQQVREAVIKQKDPKTIINDLDALDKLEFDTNNPPPYSAKVIEDKRKKLREGLRKIYQFYQKEDPKHAYEIKSLEQDYERRHLQLRSIYESVMQAQRVKLDDIPLPDLDAMPPPPPPIDLSLIPPPPPPLPAATTIIGLPDISAPPTKSILKRTSDHSAPSTTTSAAAAPLPPGLDPPGPPPSAPPDLAEFECDDDNEDNDEKTSGEDAAGKKSIRFGPVETSTLHKTSTLAATAAAIQPPLLPPPMGGPPGLGMPPYMPPLGAAGGGRPPAPPPSAAAAAAAAMYASKHAQKIQEQANRVAQQIYTNQQQQQAAAAASTIEAKPVLRNKVSEITRFVPTSLVVRRDPNKPHAPAPTTLHHHHVEPASHHAHGYDFMGKNKMTIPSANQSNAGATKSTDGAYESFMKEIEKLL